ncbi:MAG: DUF2807 domain-containing protein [Chloroflexota bacterium]|jgi:hypothetical protein
MKHICIFVLAIAAILTAGCAAVKPAADNRVTILGSGKMVSQEVAVTDFDRLDIGFAFDVTVRQGAEFKATATVDDNLADYLYLNTVDGTLQIGLKPSFAYDIPAATMRAEIVMPRLAGLALSGSSHATLIDFEVTPGFTAELSGSSALEGGVKAETVNFTLSGSTRAALSGSGQRVDIDICGNSVLDLRHFQAEEAKLEASCNATVYLDLDGQLIADASQHAQVIYRGHPDLRGVETVQSASIHPE